MSWKNVKEHYRITHSVQITPQGICIGSPYIHDIIVIGLDGKILRRYKGRSNEDLVRYMAEMDADPAKLRGLIAAPDTFVASIPVFTYDGGDIQSKFCEELGWPNVTHDGCMMYQNTFSSDKAKVVSEAKQNAVAGIKCSREHIVEAEQRLAECRARLAEDEADLAKLEAAYPSAAQA